MDFEIMNFIKKNNSYALLKTTEHFHKIIYNKHT